MVQVINVKEHNYVETNDAPDWNDIIAVSPYPSIFGPIYTFSQVFGLVIGPQSISSISYPIQLSIPIGQSTTTISNVVVNNIYVSASTDQLLGIQLLSNNQPEFTTMFYGSYSGKGAYVFSGTINIIGVNFGNQVATVFISLVGVYTTAKIVVESP